MRRLGEVEMLGLWERGHSLHPLDRALLAIEAGFPETRPDNTADWPLGRRNRALAQLRCLCFGPRFGGWAQCRQCPERLEFELDGEALADGPPSREGQPIIVNGWAFRLPTSRDLAAIAGERDQDAAARRLAERCRVDLGPEPASPASAGIEWSDADLDAVGEQLALADPLAEIVIHFDCPVCGVSFDESLDLSAFLWAELEGQAKRLLYDVHTLAAAYSWSEAEILSLSATRREFYLGMVRA